MLRYLTTCKEAHIAFWSGSSGPGSLLVRQQTSTGLFAQTQFIHFGSGPDHWCSNKLAEAGGALRKRGRPVLGVRTVHSGLGSRRLLSSGCRCFVLLRRGGCPAVGVSVRGLIALAMCMFPAIAADALLHSTMCGATVEAMEGNVDEVPAALTKFFDERGGEVGRPGLCVQSLLTDGCTYRVRSMFFYQERAHLFVYFYTGPQLNGNSEEPEGAVGVPGAAKRSSVHFTHWEQ